jgi:hypothetical protein
MTVVTEWQQFVVNKRLMAAKKAALKRCASTSSRTRASRFSFA